METDKPTPVASSTQKPAETPSAAPAWAIMGFITLIPVNVLLWQLVFR